MEIILESFSSYIGLYVFMELESDLVDLILNDTKQNFASYFCIFKASEEDYMKRGTLSKSLKSGGTCLLCPQVPTSIVVIL